jgi:hypothetical protein
MALYPNEAVGDFTVDGFSTMQDRKPDKGFSSKKSYSSISFTSEAGYDKRRLKSRRPTREYSITYTAINGLQRQAIENFYDARSGEFEAFTLNLEHIGEAGTLTVHFTGAINVKQIHTGESNVINNFYTVSFDLKETFS